MYVPRVYLHSILNVFCRESAYLIEKHIDLIFSLPKQVQGYRGDVSVKKYKPPYTGYTPHSCQKSNVQYKMSDITF